MSETFTPRKRRRNIYSYRKTFTNLAEGVISTYKNVPKFQKLFKSEEDLNRITQDPNLAKALVGYIYNNIIVNDFPSINSDDYPNTYSLSVRGDMFFFRTKDDFSFTWEYDNSKIREGEMAIVFHCLFNEPRNPLHKKSILEIGENLVNAGWEKYDRYAGYGEARNRSTSGNKVADVARITSKDGSDQIGTSDANVQEQE